MYNIHKSNSGIYYLRHNETNVLANKNKDEFIRKLILYINPTLKNAELIEAYMSVDEFDVTNELINL